MNAPLDQTDGDLPQAIAQMLQRDAVVQGLARCASGQTALPGLPAEVTAQLRNGTEASVLILIESQATAAVQQLVRQLADDKLILACHLRGAGGLLAAACGMAFAEEVGISLNLDMLTIDPDSADWGDYKTDSADWGDYKIRPEQVAVQRQEAVLKALFSENAGVLMQVPRPQRNTMLARLRQAGLSACSHVVGSLNDVDELQIFSDGRCIYQAQWAALMTKRRTDEAPDSNHASAPGTLTPSKGLP